MSTSAGAGRPYDLAVDGHRPRRPPQPARDPARAGPGRDDGPRGLALPPRALARPSAFPRQHVDDGPLRRLRRLLRGLRGVPRPLRGQGGAPATGSSSPASRTSTTWLASSHNDFPHRGYVLGATSCLRETSSPRTAGFIRRCLAVADGRPLLFKLHPNEDRERASREIEGARPRGPRLRGGQHEPHGRQLRRLGDPVLLGRLRRASPCGRRCTRTWTSPRCGGFCPSRTAVLPPGASRTYAGGSSAEREGRPQRPPARPGGAARRAGPVLIVGAGSIGRRHLRNLRTLGVERRRRPSARPTAARGRLPARAYATSRPPSARGPRAVLVCNPTSLHVDGRAGRGPRRVPTSSSRSRCPTPRGHRRPRAAVRERGLVACVGFQYRFHPTLAAREVLAREQGLWARSCPRARTGGSTCRAGTPGRTTGASYSARRDLGGGALLTLCHPFDYLRLLLGEAESVQAMAGRRSGLEMDVEDTAHVAPALRIGRAGRGVASTTCSSPPAHGLEIVGQRGTVRWNDTTAWPLLVGPDVRARRLPPRRASRATPCSSTRCGTSSPACGERSRRVHARGRSGAPCASRSPRARPPRRRAAVAMSDPRERVGRVVALIPARGGSKSIPRKNLRPLGGHPLVAWSIAAARERRRGSSS